MFYWSKIPCRQASHQKKMVRHCYIRVVSRAGLLGSGRVRAGFGAGFRLKFVKMFLADFGPSDTSFYTIRTNDCFLS